MRACFTRIYNNKKKLKYSKNQNSVEIPDAGRRLEPEMFGNGYTVLQTIFADTHARGTGIDSGVEYFRASGWQLFRRERYHRVQLNEVAADDRPPGPGEQMAKNDGKRKQVVRDQVVQQELREYDTVSHRTRFAGLVGKRTRRNWRDTRWNYNILCVCVVFRNTCEFYGGFIFHTYTLVFVI